MMAELVGVVRTCRRSGDKREVTGRDFTGTSQWLSFDAVVTNHDALDFYEPEFREALAALG